MPRTVTCNRTAVLPSARHNVASTDADAASDFLFLRRSSAVSLHSREPGASKVSHRRVWRSKNLRNQARQQSHELDVAAPQHDPIVPQQLQEIVRQIIDVLGTSIQSPSPRNTEAEKPRQQSQCFREPELRRTCRLRSLSIKGRAGSPAPIQKSPNQDLCESSQGLTEVDSWGDWESQGSPMSPGRRAEEPEGEPRVQMLRWTRRFNSADCNPSQEVNDFNLGTTPRKSLSRQSSSLHCRRMSLSQSLRDLDKDAPGMEDLLQPAAQGESHTNQQGHRRSWTGSAELEGEDFLKAPFVPPNSSAWEWPLSRTEKKSLITMFDRRMLIADNRMLEEEVSHLRRSSCTGIRN